MKKHESTSMLPFSWLNTLNALFFLIIFSLSCSAFADSSQLINVKDFGALADGIHDDGPAIQAALKAAEESGGETVYLPIGTYFFSNSLIVGDDTTITGDGAVTVLKRGNNPSLSPVYGNEANCKEKDVTKIIYRSSRNFFTNRHYNCGNKGIILRDFKIDGSMISDAPTSVAIAFSAVKDTHIERLYIYEVPQDAIFFRNGGIRSSVTETIIDGFNMHWPNGAGINVEMHGNGNLPGRLVVKNNTIINRAPASFCFDGEDSCTKSQISSINFNRPKKAAGKPAEGYIVGNSIWLNNKHKGIDCFACKDTKIVNNVIRPWIDPEIPFAEQNTSFVGIEVSGSNLTIMNNYIQGSGQLVDGKGIDGRGILVKAEVIWPDLNTTNLVLSKNIVKNKRIKPTRNLAAIEVKGATDFIISSNRVEDTTENPIQANGLVIGSCENNDKYPTVGGLVENNLLSVPNDSVSGGYWPLILRGTSDIRMKNNKPSDNPSLQCGAEELT